jgi:uncharacterized repeat protein (TIGR03803 family)
MKPNHAFQTCRLFMACLFLTVLAPNIDAQVVTLHNFSKFTNSSQDNSDGYDPHGNLLLVGTNLYGTVYTGGAYGKGTLFAISTNGMYFTNLHNFGKPSTTDGVQPICALIQVGNKLYGTCQGASPISGNLFSINLDGSGYTNFYSFSFPVADPSDFMLTNANGAFPQGGLVASGNRLYGTTVDGGPMGSGTIFAIDTDGTGFTNLHSFALVSGPDGTNSEGSNPYDALVVSGGMLYGTAYNGGGFGYGSVFSMSTNGGSFTNLHSFPLIGSDGSNPYSSLLLANGVLYGATSFAGDFNTGTIFKINTDGTGFGVLHEFSKDNFGTDYDGENPYCTLILLGDTLIGTGADGGTNTTGTIFTVNINGNNFAAISHFGWIENNGDGTYTNAHGAYPKGGVILAGNTLYGMAEFGGDVNHGTVFGLALPSTSSLEITHTGTGMTISWPITAVGFDLQGCTDISAANWTNVVTGLTVVATNFVFTSSFDEPSTYFRLHR